MTRLLGLDPGTAIIGYGVIDLEGTSPPRMIGCGVIRTEAGSPRGERLRTLFHDLTELLEQVQPDLVVLEKLFAFRNVTTVIGVAEARGVMLLACELAELPVREVTPMEAKLSIAGHGRASKKEVQEGVRDLLRLDFVPKPDDAADALAIALTMLPRLELEPIPGKVELR
jgi:crossover junction endodeoxyribonuclease RuvC